MNELQHRLVGDLASRADRDVVDEDRERRRGSDSGEVRSDTVLGRAVVVRVTARIPAAPHRSPPA